MKMRKRIFSRTLLLVGVFVLLCTGVRWCAVRGMAWNGASRAAMELAAKKIEADRKILSARALALDDAAQSKKPPIDERLAELMGDPDMNRLALLYMGADWTIPRGAFLDGVRTIRELERMRSEDRVRLVKKLKDDLRKIDRRTSTLCMRMNGPVDAARRDAERRALARQKAELTNSEVYREFIKTDALLAKNADAKAAAEAAVAELAAKYREATIVRLDAVLAERLAGERESMLVCAWAEKLSALSDFWPLNVLIPADPGGKTT